MGVQRLESLLGVFASLLLISNGLPPNIKEQLQEEFRNGGAFSGTIHYSGNAEYQRLRLGYNGACRSLFPAAILRPETTEDVAAGVKTANKLGMEISVRSGGHDYICASLKNDSLHFDLRKINVIELLPEEEVPEKYALEPGVRLARLGTGNLWKDVLKVLPQDRYTMVHGQCLTVGVGGYLLKGGFNYLGGSARHGNGARHVVRYTMVSPKGEIMVVDRDGVTKFNEGRNEVETVPFEHDNDLFYGLKIAGTSLGIVTEFLYKIFEEPEPTPVYVPVTVRNSEDLMKFRNLREEGNYEVALNRLYNLRTRWISGRTTGTRLFFYAAHFLQILTGRPTLAVMISDKGRYLYDVRTERGGGGVVAMRTK